MHHSGTRNHVEPCVWMSAGVLNYKLCERDFDCERCPLDAALRGKSLQSPAQMTLLTPSHEASTFPDDRLYSTGHSWLQPVEGRDKRMRRFGLDAFAAALIGRCCEVKCEVSRRAFARGETICEIDLGIGVLPVGAPVASAILDGNPCLWDDPGQLVTSPYDDGWIIHLTGEDPSAFDELFTADAAREHALHDLRLFRRRVAYRLLADAEVIGPILADGGEPLADLREMLGGTAYMDLLRELIH